MKIFIFISFPEAHHLITTEMGTENRKLEVPYQQTRFRIQP